MFSLQTIFGSGKQFYSLLDSAAFAAHESTAALHEILEAETNERGLESIRLARLRQREASSKISKALVESFITPIEREDIEALRVALGKISKQAERFANRHELAKHRLDGIDFVSRAAMLEQAPGIVLKMVKELPRLRLEPIKAYDDELNRIEMEADKLLLELYRDIYSGKLNDAQAFLLKEFFEILEKAIDRCRDAGEIIYYVALKSG